MKIKHIMLRVYNIEKSLKFYESVLGLKVVAEKDVKGAKISYLAEDQNDTQLALCYNYDHPEKYSHGTHFGHIGYEVKSIDAFSKKLDDLNVEYDRLPFEGRDGYLAFVKDPDGHSIEIIEFYKK